MAQVLALWLAFAFYHQAKSEISGHVTAEIEGAATNQPIQAAQVRLYFLEQVLTTESDASGDFVFRKVPLGNYALVVIAQGFKPFRKAVTVTEKEPAPAMKIAIGAANEPSSCNAPSISYQFYQLSQTGHLSLRAADSSQTSGSLAGIVFSVKGRAGHPAERYTLIARDGAADLFLSPGSYTVSVGGRGFHEQESDVFVPRDNVTTVRFSVVRKELQVVCQ